MFTDGGLAGDAGLFDGCQVGLADQHTGMSYHGNHEGHQQHHGGEHGDPEGRKGKRGERKSPDGLRSTNPTLPKLPSMTAKTASVDMADWLIEVQPAIGDLSNRATKWWQATVEAAMQRYNQWLMASPLERLRLVAPRPDLGETVGSAVAAQRLEQRVTTLLMPTLPEELKTDLVGNRTLWPAAILYRILRSYQPGGWTERGDLLQGLINTTAAKTPSLAASLHHCLI